MFPEEPCKAHDSVVKANQMVGTKHVLNKHSIYINTMDNSVTGTGILSANTNTHSEEEMPTGLISSFTAEWR